MKSRNSNATKIKVKDLKNRIYSGTRSRFIPPRDYRTNITLLHHCRYCKKYKFTKELSVYDGKLVYVCPECGGRHKYSMAKINFHRFLKMLLMLIIAFCGFVIAMHFVDFPTPTPPAYENYSELKMGYNPFDLDSETSKDFLFVPEESGYYVFNSLFDSEPQDVNGKLIVDDEIVYQNDNFEKTKCFYIIYYLEAGQEAVLSVDAHGEPMTRFEVEVKTKSARYAKAIEKFAQAQSGIYVSNEDTLYMHDPSYDNSTWNYYESGDRIATSFSIDEDDNTLWLSFDAEDEDEGDISVWLPIDIE